MTIKSDKDIPLNASMLLVLFTGAAEFTSYHTYQTMLNSGMRVVGLDKLNPYYDVPLKEARFAQRMSV